MSAPSGDRAAEEAGAENLVNLFDDINQAKAEESRKPGVFTYFLRNPLMAGGMLATGFFMFKGIRAASAGESHTLAEMLQKRVLGQFGTLAIIVSGFLYFTTRDPKAMKNSLEESNALSARALMNYQEAQRRNGS